MRSVIPIVMAAAIAGCAPPPPAQIAAEQARTQARLAELTAGMVPGPPQSCLPPYRSDDMIVIDDSTIVFRDTPNRVWVMRTQNPCNLLSAGPYALVTKSVGGMGLCRGDIGQVADPVSNTTVGTCVMGDFIPYTRPGG